MRAPEKEGCIRMAVQSNDRKKATNTDRRNIWLLVITTLLVIGSIIMFMPPQEKINQGLDIQGGLSVVLTATSTDGDAITDEEMEMSRAIIESRVNALGASEAVVQVQGTNQILVQIPGLSDTETALNTIGKTGKLEFARLDSFTDEKEKKKIPTICARAMSRPSRSSKSSSIRETESRRLRNPQST